MDLSQVQKPGRADRYGKRLPSTVYVYREGNTRFGGGLDSMVEALVGQHAIPPDFNVLKFRTDEFKISFLSYPGFLTEAHPSLLRSVAVDLLSGKARHADYSENINPPILHRKEQFVPADHPRRSEFLALTEAEEAEGLYSRTSTIGFKLNWERLLAGKGLSIEGHELRRIDGDWVDAPAQEVGPEVQRHRTALRRYEAFEAHQMPPSIWSAETRKELFRLWLRVGER